MSKTTTLSLIQQLTYEWCCPAAPVLGEHGYFSQARIAFHGWAGTRERPVRLYGVNLTVSLALEPFYWETGARDISCEVASLVEWDIPCTLNFGQALEVMTQAFVRNVSVGVDPYDLEVLVARKPKEKYPSEVVRLLSVIRNTQIDAANGLVPRDQAFGDFFCRGITK